MIKILALLACSAVLSLCSGCVSLGKGEPLSVYEKGFVDVRIERMRPKLSHEIASPVTTEMKWKKMRESVLGKFHHLKPREIVLNKAYRNTLEFMISTIAHELRHKKQFEKNPTLYMTACSLFLREHLLEPSAREVEREADTLMGMEGLRNGDDR